MSNRFAAILSAAVLALPGFAQAPAAKASGKAASTWKAPRTPEGHPDLQGIWSNATVTPLERPGEFAGKAVLSDQEAAEFATEVVERTNGDRRDGAGTDADVARAYNDFWYDRGTKTIKTRRTSLIVDPPDGRIPPLTAEAKKRMAARAERRRLHPADGPEDRGLSERCLNWRTAGPPMLPGAYNNNYQIVQTPDTVVIFNEMIHDARIIPMDGRPHVPAGIRLWLGDSRGHWEGDTLVVETTNFSDKTAFQGASENMRLTERFTRVDPDTLLYEFTVNDPAAFARPWTAQIPSVRSDGPIFEYACHEGNYGMYGILSSARAEEKKKAGN
ncbi:MAG TPA: hypothetical protein VJ732_04475 [Bryobacteraceae bacterium]|nr:hypothetical protein [Bryobacteraceae bacterium]